MNLLSSVTNAEDGTHDDQDRAVSSSQEYHTGIPISDNKDDFLSVKLFGHNNNVKDENDFIPSQLPQQNRQQFSLVCDPTSPLLPPRNCKNSQSIKNQRYSTAVDFLREKREEEQKVEMKRIELEEEILAFKRAELKFQREKFEYGRKEREERLEQKLSKEICS